MASTKSSSAKIIVRSLYRNLLRTVKPFTSPSKNAVVLSCLLQRTGIDDHIKDWDEFIKQKSFEHSNIKENASDLSISYTERWQKDLSASLASIEEAGSQSSSSTSTNRQTYQRLFRRLLREIVTGANGYAKMIFPSQVDSTRLRRVIQREFRNDHDSISTDFDNETRRQVAFTALRELNKKLSYYENLNKRAPEPIPHQAAWHVSELPCHPPSSYLRPGVFLVSHPFMNDSFFSKTVICILEHVPIGDTISDSDVTSRSIRQPKTPGQTYGLIVNRVSVHKPTGRNRTLREAFQEHMLPIRMAQIFGDSVVREGGPVHVALQMIYSLSSSSADQEEVSSALGGTIIPTVTTDEEQSPALYSDRATYFQGNVFKAMTEVENGRLDRDDISFFVGASTWSPGQLASEIAQGYWIPCRGPPEMALHGICDHEPTVSGRRPVADLWLSMMSACGDDASKLAHLFYHDHRWDENGLPCDLFDDDDDDIFLYYQ